MILNNCRANLESQLRTHDVGTPLAKLKEKLQNQVEPDSCFSMVMRQPLFNSTPKSIDNLNSKNNFASRDVSPDVSPRSRPKMSNFGKTPKKDSNFEGGFGQAMSLFAKRDDPENQKNEEEEEKK